MSSSQQAIQKFHAAISCREELNVEKMLKQGMDPNCRRETLIGLTDHLNTPLHSASLSEAPPRIIQMLLEAGADPNLRNAAQATPLHYERRSEMVERLLKAGADPRLQDHFGQTPLHKQWNSEAFSFLLAAGADVNAQDYSGGTALHGTTFQDQMEVLLQAGANLNLQDNAGNTVLHLEISYNRPEYVMRLIQAGSDLFILNNEGQRPDEMPGSLFPNDELRAQVRQIRITQEQQTLSQSLREVVPEFPRRASRSRM